MAWTRRLIDAVNADDETDPRCDASASHRILAEHPRARLAGTRVEKPEHVRERWQRSTAPPSPPPRKGCIVTFGDEVQHRPLSLYQEIAS